MSAAPLSAACQWTLVCACGRASLRCQTRKMSETYRQTCILSHKNHKKVKTLRTALCYFPSIHFLKHSCFLTAYPSQPALLPVVALIQHQPVYLPPPPPPTPNSPLSGIKVAVIGVIIQLYADSLSLNPLRSALCHAWLTCLR